MVDAIISRLRPTLLETEGRRRTSVEAGSFDAWDLTVQGWFHANKHTTEGFLAGIERFEHARQLEPDFVPAIAAAASVWSWLMMSGWRHEDMNPWERAREAAESAYRLDADHYTALAALSVTKSFNEDPAEGTRYAQRLVELNPHAAIGFHILGVGLYLDGRSEEAIPTQTQAWRLGQHEPWRYDTANGLAYSHYLIRNYEAALTWGEQALQLVDEWLQTSIVVAATYGQLDRAEEGRRHVETILNHRPDFSCAKHRTRLLFTRPEDRDHIIEGLLKTGLPR